MNLETAAPDDYAADGVVVVRGLLSPAQVATLAAAVDRAMAAPGPMALDFNDRGSPGRFFGDMFMWQRDADFRAAFFDTPAAATAGRLMAASHVHLFYDQIFAKEPGTPRRTPWHQDATYWPVTGDMLATAYLALDPIDATNGAVEYVAGSHRWAVDFAPAPFREGGSEARRYVKSPLPPLPDIDAQRGSLDMRSFELAPGDAVVFHGRLVHGAGGNPSGRRRRTVALRFAGDDVRWRPHSGTFKPLARAGLAAGAPLSGPLFPILWRREEAGHVAA
ncbi:MAG: phytanoyl-CoA dioxygenase family protein [Alphaproteobacteria bacterium]|nr:phytanoyl-CoA dioxygenase family protein [Alphaproteobacteria bacterium]